jgi:hypothetical protein
MIEASIRVSKCETRRNLAVAATRNVPIALGAEIANFRRPAAFEALPVTFDITDAEFVKRFLPWVRLACLWLRHDHIGAEALARDMLRQGGEFRLDETDNAWTSCVQTFGAISEYMEAAKVRLNIARAEIQGEQEEHALTMSARERTRRSTAGRHPPLGPHKNKPNLHAVRDRMRPSGSAAASLRGQ